MKQVDFFSMHIEHIPSTAKLFEASPRIRIRNEHNKKFDFFSILNLEYDFRSFYQPSEIVCLLLPLLTDALILLLLSNNNAPGNQNR